MQLTDAQDKIAHLESNLHSLSTQLELAKRNEKQLSDTLATTREALQLFQVTAHQKVEHKDQELSQLQCEMTILEQQKKTLERQVGESQREVERLEAAHGRAREEVERLKEECGELRSNHEACVGEREAELKQVRQNVGCCYHSLCDDLYPTFLRFCWCLYERESYTLEYTTVDWDIFADKIFRLQVNFSCSLNFVA